MPKIVPYLWFETQAEEAAHFYASLFGNSKVERVTHYTKAGPLPEGTVMTVGFSLDGQPFLALNGGDPAPASHKLALFVECETQAEVDRLWDALAEGGQKIQCGWVTDKYGFTWNLVPKGIEDYLAGENPDGAQRAMKAMLQMQKIDIDELRRAYEGA